MGFFILLKYYKSCSAFVNFCFNFYKDDFYILVPARSLKAGPIRSNALEERTPKPGIHRPKDHQWSKVSKGINTRDNGFKDLNSWESIKRRPFMSEDRLYKLVES